MLVFKPAPNVVYCSWPLLFVNVVQLLFRPELGPKRGIFCLLGHKISLAPPLAAPSSHGAARLTAAGARTLQFLSGIASSLAWEDSNHGTRDPKGEGRTAVHQGDSSGAPQYSSALHPHAGDKPLHSARHEQCSCTALTPSIEVRIIITCRRLSPA